MQRKRDISVIWRADFSEPVQLKLTGWLVGWLIDCGCRRNCITSIKQFDSWGYVVPMILSLALASALDNFPLWFRRVAIALLSIEHMQRIT